MNPDTERSIAAIAARQHGVFTRAQAAQCGAGRAFIDRRVRIGVWRARTPHVLSVAGAPDSPYARLLAAVLHVGPGAVASHHAAAALAGLPGFDLSDVHITRPRGLPWRPPPYGAVHEAALWADTAALQGIPATTVPRTLLDLAATEHPHRVERALDNALAMRLTSVATLKMAVRTYRWRPGVRLLRSLVDARSSAYVPPASELEARFLELVRQAGLPEPDRQVVVGGPTPAGRADVVWRDAALVVELDSRRHHSARLDVQDDVRRDVAAARGGWRVLRLTWEDVFAYPGRTMARLRAGLDDAATRPRAG